MTGNHFDELETTRAWKEDTLAKITVYSMQVGKYSVSMYLDTDINTKSELGALRTSLLERKRTDL